MSSEPDYENVDLALEIEAGDLRFKTNIEDAIRDLMSHEPDPYTVMVLALGAVYQGKMAEDLDRRAWITLQAAQMVLERAGWIA